MCERMQNALSGKGNDVAPRILWVEAANHSRKKWSNAITWKMRKPPR
ncbi:hypothetical protein SAMN05421548_1073 [Paraburkholderia lycopersici]|uniref:Uncharacterized protein n=1 Tax=Paraburkholderia lycopersici TaxID=416944 RepID=A0A1G6LPK6_9BURK|nr:hypothetical protein SAMN05421548_1073 [Paraburkholderia lycopersici]